MRVRRKAPHFSTDSSQDQSVQLLRFNDLRNENERLQVVQRRSIDGNDGVVQRIMNIRGLQFSNDESYVINPKNRKFLAVEQNATAPSPIDHFKKVASKNGYNLFEAKMRFGDTTGHMKGHNDCGQYASTLMLNRANMGDDEVRNADMQAYEKGFDRNQNQMIDKPGGLIFGNQEGVMNEGTKAAPEVGEAYFMWQKHHGKLYNKGGCYFHVAAVVATDGGDRITCEGDSKDKERTQPLFFMYGTDKKYPEETFQYQYRNTYQSLAVGKRDKPDNRVTTIRTTGARRPDGDPNNYTYMERLLATMKGVGLDQR